MSIVGGVAKIKRCFGHNLRVWKSCDERKRHRPIIACWKLEGILHATSDTGCCLHVQHLSCDKWQNKRVSRRMEEHPYGVCVKIANIEVRVLTLAPPELTPNVICTDSAVNLHSTRPREAKSSLAVWLAIKATACMREREWGHGGSVLPLHRTGCRVFVNKRSGH